MLPLYRAALTAALLGGGPAALAQEPAKPGMSLAEMAAKRFPQPVRVGDLIHRTVLRPVESQTVLGRVEGVVRDGGGHVSVLVDYGGLLGVGGRVIAVPVEAMVLLGQVMEIVDFTPEQLDHFPTYAGPGSDEVPADQMIKVGLARPSH